VTSFRLPRDGRGCLHQGLDPLGIVRAPLPTPYHCLNSHPSITFDLYWFRYFR
jgi:hypothetical protein